MTAPDHGSRPQQEHRPDVRVAEYLYRHEAEFAAGFLTDAGIPFRLQIDDAGGADAGVTIARPAVLWVRADDEEEARALLGLDDQIGLTGAEGHDGDDADPRPIDTVPMRRLPVFEPLCRVERIVAGVLALAFFAMAAAGGEGAVPWVGVWESIALGLALALGLSAVSGQTLGSIRVILRVLSGTAP